MASEKRLADQMAKIEGWFSRLLPGTYSIESIASSSYNCIAFAIGYRDRWYWPRRPKTKSYWPTGALNDITVEAFAQAFSIEGFVRCSDDSMEEGFEKVALYVKNGKPSHAARQMPDGSWASKLGNHEDIVHPLFGVTGDGQHEYGDAVAFFKRQRKPTRRPDRDKQKN